MMTLYRNPLYHCQWRRLDYTCSSQRGHQAANIKQRQKLIILVQNGWVTLNGIWTKTFITRVTRLTYELLLVGTHVVVVCQRQQKGNQFVAKKLMRFLQCWLVTQFHLASHSTRTSSVLTCVEL